MIEEAGHGLVRSMYVTSSTIKNSIIVFPVPFMRSLKGPEFPGTLASPEIGHDDDTMSRRKTRLVLIGSDQGATSLHSIVS